MMPNKKLIFSYLLLILMGVGLLMWLFSGQNKYSVSPEMDTDSTSVITVQETAAIDTAKDIEVIRAYYKFLKEDTSEWAEFKKQEHNYLTQTLIDKLAYYDDAVFFPLCPLDDIRTLSSHNLKILSLGNEWYRARLYDSSVKDWINIPVRMVTDKDGRRKIGYAIPYGWDGTILDTLVYDHVVKVNGKEQNGLRFLKAFFRSYISLNHTIDLDAPAYRKYLCETFIDKKRWNDDESRMLIINFLEGLWDDTTQQLKEYTISPDIRKGLYKVRVKIEGDLYYEYILKMEKRNEHFVITALNWKEENTSSDVEMPQNCDLEQLPQFPGGTDTLMAYLSKHIIYPKEEEKAGHEGRVIITFVVNRDGSISNAKVTRSAFKGLDEEALRVVRSMPAWEPGRIDGNPVPVSFSLPINFKLK